MQGVGDDIMTRLTHLNAFHPSEHLEYPVGLLQKTRGPKSSEATYVQSRFDGWIQSMGGLVPSSWPCCRRVTCRIQRVVFD